MSNPLLTILAGCFLITVGLQAASAATEGESPRQLQERTTWPCPLPPDTLDPAALLDLRYLNEEQAGMHGFVSVDAEGGFRRGDGEPLRFWSTVVKWQTKDPAEMDRLAGWLAKRGVNLVRLHPRIWTREVKQFGQIDRQEHDHVRQMVAALKNHGIYTQLLLYSAMDGQGLHDRVEGVPVGREVRSPLQTGILFLHEGLQEFLKEWTTALLTEPNPHTGLPLAEDPAVALIEIQNEDSLLFHTVRNLQGEDLRLAQSLYGQWLAQRYGSLEQALTAWGGARAEGDDLAEGRAGFYHLWDLTRAGMAHHRPSAAARRRMADQTQWYTETMRNFNKEFITFLREECGVRVPTIPGNWRTADDVTLIENERYSYAVGEVIAANRYFTGVHAGSRTHYWVSQDDHFAPAAIVLEPERLPINVRQFKGKAFAVPETMWVEPNTYQSEGALAIAAYQSLTGVDIVHWYHQRGDDWHTPATWRPGYGKFSANTPMIQGLWPAAALLFRQGYLQQARPVLIERRSLQALWQREEPVIAEQAVFDPNRDISDEARASGFEGPVDPLAFMVGPVLVDYSEDPQPSELIDLTPYIDRDGRIVRARTGEIALDYGLGLLRVEAPKVQAAAGFLGRAGRQEFADVTIDSGNEFASVIIIAMDDRPLRESARVLVQVGTRQEPTGWDVEEAEFTTRDQTVQGFKIVDVGGPPWQIERADVRVRVANPSLRTAHVLDINGMPVATVPLDRDTDSVTFRFPVDALYVVLE